MRSFPKLSNITLGFFESLQMNQILLEFRKQAIDYCLDRGSQTNLSQEVDEKFAELIVRECVERIKRVGILEDIENETDMVVNAVKEHFGVK